MRSLFVFTVSLRAVGRLVGVGLMCLAALVLVGVIAGPGIAVLAMLALFLLARAVVHAIRS
jgi:hypothetical protein